MTADIEVAGRRWCCPGRGRLRGVDVAERTCSVDGCEREAKSLGYCLLHYMRWWRTGDVRTAAERGVHACQKPCTVDGCHDPAAGRAGLCKKHWERFKRLGQVELPARQAAGWVTDQGYHWRCAPDHPLATRAGTVATHRAVLWDAIGPGIHPCNWCQRPVRWDGTWPIDADALVVDHLDHVRLNNDRENLVPSCQPCNVRRNKEVS